jgi:hypothetical protein
MLAVPAGIAGCKTIVVATPPRKDGSIAPEVLYCAKKAGVTHILKAGGAQVGCFSWATPWIGMLSEGDRLVVALCCSGLSTLFLIGQIRITF